MSNSVTLIAQTSPLVFEKRVTTRPLSPHDAAALAVLSLAAYHQDPVSEEDVAQKQETIQAIFAGSRGPLLLEVCLAAVDEMGAILAAVLVSRRPNDSEAPQVPHFVELITAPEHRRQGLAEQLVLIAMETLSQAHYEHIAVRVDDSNAAALALYLSMDFARWEKDEDGK